MGTRPEATTNMNLSTVASLVLLAAVGTFAYPNYGDSVAPYEDFAQAPEMELETFEETDAATQFVTLALYNTISQANDFEMNQWTNDAQLTQQEFGWAKKGLQKAGSAIKKGATAVYNKGQAMCKNVLCPALVTYISGQTGGAGAFLSPLLKSGCNAACSFAEKKLHEAVAKMVKDPKLPKTVCDKLLGKR